MICCQWQQRGQETTHADGDDCKVTAGGDAAENVSVRYYVK